MLTLAAANTFGGGTTVSAGELQLGNSAALGSGGLAVNGGTLDLGGYSVTVSSFSGAGGFVTNSGGTDAVFTVNQAGNTVFHGQIDDGATNKVALVKSGSGRLILFAASNYTGGTTLNAGVLQLGNYYVLGSGGLVANAGTLDLAGWSQTVHQPQRLGGPHRQYQRWHLHAVLTVNQSSNTTYQRPDQRRQLHVALVKQGSGTLTLANANGYSGGTTVSGRRCCNWELRRRWAAAPWPSTAARSTWAATASPCPASAATAASSPTAPWPISP